MRRQILVRSPNAFAVKVRPRFAGAKVLSICCMENPVLSSAPPAASMRWEEDLRREPPSGQVCFETLLCSQ